jgi:DNA repair exonuclease SbcCD ATPase subunit
MREQLQRRLEQLKQEFETGQARLEEIERQASFLRETMLRISGAIQVLEEELAKAGAPDPSPVEGEPGNGRQAAAAGVYGVGEQSARP